MAAPTTLSEYATRWLATIAETKKPTTTRRYTQIVRDYLACDPLGSVPLREITRQHCRETLLAMKRLGRADATRRTALAVLQSLLTSAQVDDELIPHNPALGLRKRLGLVPATRNQAEEVVALTAPELTAFLAGARRWYAQVAPLFEVMARAALRLGETLALRREDRDPGELRVRRQYTDRQLLRPKGGRRTVEIGRELEALLDGLEAPGPWLFPSRRPGPRLPLWDATWIGRVAEAIATRAGVPRVHPHMLRHTAASLWLAQGEPVEWVSRQLGHTSTAFTERVYGRWIRAHNPAGLRRYDQLLAGERSDAPLIPGRRVMR
jgi:integrase